ncbi:protein kinase [Methanogenium sp. S4BF]|uniref:protein kinase domain-containing protein n=1 Tax=Methanogenium sp. S4BF TaxID=1789226 RepID=UPI00241782C8|nr:protein kinase [Methanogenium sp. S4BF]WFN35656.1 protein kinase [Methanogenium sp. S4BF]
MRRDDPQTGIRACRSGGFVRMLVALLLLCTALLCSPGSAAALTVGEDGYGTISAALAAAMPGDEIRVESGTYSEHLNITVPVTITGVNTGGGLPVIMAKEGEAALVVDAPGTTIEGLFITGIVPCGIFVHADNTVITGNTIATTIPGTGVGICIYDADRTVVTGNRIEGERIGILVSESDGTAVYFNEIDCIIGAVSSSPETSWISPELTYVYEGSSFAGQVGNSWSGYAGADFGGDGIGDEPYVVPSLSPAQFNAWRDDDEASPFERRPFDLMGELTGGVIVEDTAPLISGIDAYSVTSPSRMQRDTPGPGPGPNGTGPFEFPREPEGFFWPAFAFLGSLLVGGLLTAADRRARHRTVLNRDGHTVPVLTAGYTILAVMCSSAMFLTGFQSLLVLQTVPGANPVLVGLAFLSVAGIILAATTATESSPRYLLGAYLIVAGSVAVISAALVLDGQGGPGSSVPLFLCLAAVLLGSYHRSRFVTPQVSGDTDERTRIAHVGGDPFDETRIMDTQLRDVYFPATLSDRYREVTFIGKGGLARVFRAVRRKDGAVVAVKVPISFDETTGRIFLKEMKLWEGLSHPNIVRICSVNILPVPYVEMEYVPKSLAGVTLPLPPEEAVVIVEGIVRGLMYAHEHGIIHRDIKPHNILLAEENTAKITDWGLGAVMGDGHESSVVGFSIQYAAPEQIAPRRFGDADPRTDIYQTGIVFYELLTGRRPFGDGGLGEMTDAILSEIPAPPSSRVPAAAPWDDIVMRCIAKEKGDRYPSAAALAEALDTTSKEP